MRAGHVVPSATAVLLAFLAAGCRRAPEPPHAVAATTSPRPAQQAAQGTCEGCHAAEVTAFGRSAHALAARATGKGVAPFAALAKEAGTAPSAKDAGSATFTVDNDGWHGLQRLADASGDVQDRPIVAVLGGRRREDFLGKAPDGRLHVLELSWSTTRRAWADAAAEESGHPLGHDAPQWWSQRSRDYQQRCARCHALPGSDSAGATGIACATCHPRAEEHAAAARGGAPDARRVAAGSADASDRWHGCGTCHAVGQWMPRLAAHDATSPLTDLLIPATLATQDGFDSAFALDGRPMIPHGYEVQALAQSACARKGGATCITCHDPHGGAGAALRNADPDASCRTCHAEIAKAPAAHAHHPVSASPVPLAAIEPRGPEGGRLPGCVDCHAPALLGFSPADRVRDHAIGIPARESARRLHLADACGTCHAQQKPIVAPSREPPRERWARAFEASWAASVGAERPDASKLIATSLTLLSGVLSDGEADPWTKASAASLLGVLGAGHADAAAALEKGWRKADDVVLVKAAARAHAMAGGPLDPLLELATSSEDWRVRVVAAAGLSAQRDERGTAKLDVLYHDATLPPEGRNAAAFELAVALISRHAYERAEVLLLESLKAEPEHVAAWVDLGVARAQHGDSAGARQAWEQALVLQPGQPVAVANLRLLDQAAPHQ